MTAAEDLGSARLIVLCGVSFAGKSTVAGAIAARTGALVVSLDAVNAERGLDSGAGIPVEQWQLTHQIAGDRVRVGLAGGGTVVVDDTGSLRVLRERWRALADESGVRSVLVQVTVDAAEMVARLRRNRADAVRPDVLDGVLAGFLADFEPPGPEENPLRVTSDEHLADWVADRFPPAPPSGADAAGVTVRTAEPGDLEAILDLTQARRRRYARYQPVFWRPAADARARQRPYLAAQLAEADTLALVATRPDGSVVGVAVGRIGAAPPVHDPGGLTCLVDDFTVVDPAAWATTGANLLAALRRAAAARGAVQLVVVTAHLDTAQRGALRAGGLEPASEWWVGPTTP